MTESKEAWERTQTKTFTKWFNNHLRKKNYPPISDPSTDFESGIKLMQIVNALYDVPIPKHNANPKLRPHKLDNIELALKMVEQAKIKTNFLKHTHLIDHDNKMILGMMWAVILDYAIKGISEEEMTAKEGLLLWCRKKTSGYRDIDPPGVQNFTASFTNGLAFLALIHKHQPQLVEYDSLSKDNAAANLEQAFSLAEQQLGIPRLLDVEDMLVDKPDERSVMTYVSEYFHRFAQQEAKEASARRAAKFLHFIRSTNAMKAAYEQQATELLEWVKAVVSGWEGEHDTDNLDDAQAQVDRLKKFVLEDEPSHQAAKLDLEALYAQVQTQLKVNGRQAYAVSEHLSPDAVEESFHQLYLARQQYARKARDNRFRFIQKEESHLSDDKVAEFKDSFSHFDTVKDGYLLKDEFKAAASSVGVSLKDDELPATYAQVSEGNAEGVGEEAYVRWLTTLSEDRDTAEQVVASFSALADGKQYVTVDGLRQGGLSAEDAEALGQLMPKNEQGELDFTAYVQSEYAQSQPAAATE
ncbi:actinin alpha 2 [Xylographa carneopallida]|nr:actinin alpha 2 [Xylographa carneopallida]